MRFGIDIFPTDKTIQPIELAKAVEERGFESLWLPEHSHIPVSRKSPWGGQEGAPPLPEHYWRSHDAFVALGAAAAVTTTLKLGTGISLVAQRDPLWTAKQVASLDVISGGRMIFGVGYGWNKEEMASHGIRYLDRRELLREKILMMKSLWTDDVAHFEGTHLALEPSWAWPKPVQKPHPKIVLGAAAGPRTIEHLVEFCDGWIPLGRHALRTEEVRNALVAAGRDIETFEFTYFGAKPTKEFVDRLITHGIQRVVFHIDSIEPLGVIAQLDTCALLMEQYPT